LAQAPSLKQALDRIRWRQVKHIEQLQDDIDAKLEVTYPQRLASLIAVGRLEKMLRVGEDEYEPGRAGSEVRRYAAAFAKANGVSRGKKDARSSRPTLVSSRSGGADGDDPDDAA
jgi:hypothetical protein